MKHLFIPYELAVIAKEKGFNDECLAYYYDKEIRYTAIRLSNTNNFWEPDARALTAPLYQQIVDWFRDVHKIHISVLANSNGVNFSSFEYTLFGMQRHIKTDSCKTYNEALNKAITEAFKLIS